MNRNKTTTFYRLSIYGFRFIGELLAFVPPYSIKGPSVDSLGPSHLFGKRLMESLP
jgi:hypothetical protein